MKIKYLFFCLVVLVILNGLGMGILAKEEDKTIKSAIIVVDPGYSKFSLKVARIFEENLKRKAIEVQLIESKKFHANDMKKVELLVLGGPTYAFQPTTSVKKALLGLNPASKPEVILFATSASIVGGPRSLVALHKIAEEKGLTVVKSCGFSVKDKNVEERITKLLEDI